jgi:hypothetical protein
VPVEVKYLVPEVFDIMQICNLLIFHKSFICAVVDSESHLLAMFYDRIALCYKVKLSVNRVVNSNLL